MLSWVVIDFETASVCDLKKAGAWRYSEDPTTEVICLAWQHQDGAKGVWCPSDQYSAPAGYAADETVTFIAHNAAFEKAIWRNIMVPVYDWPDIPNSRWHDTMAVCAMKVIPQDLEHAVLTLRLPGQKDMDGSKLVKSLSKPDKRGHYDRTPETLKKTYSYCGNDVVAEIGLHLRVGWLPIGERSVWLLDQRINERGVRLDLPFIKAAKEVVEKASVPLAQEFAEITGGLKMSQVAKVGDWCQAQGVSIPNMQKETLAELLGESEDEDVEGSEDTPELPDNVRRALVIRQLIGSASIKKLGRMEACVCADGRARGVLQYHGAGPGRWAGRLFQPQNFPRGTLAIDGGGAPDPGPVVDAIMSGDPDYVAAVIGPPVETVVSALRHAIVATPGRQLLSGDFSTIEARIVLALAGQHDKLKIMAAGQDIYCDMAAEIYKKPINKKDNPKERQVGKNSVLGLGFQMGAPKFQSRYAKKEPIEFAENVVRTYRKEWAPLVPEVWYGLEEAAVRTVWDKTPHEEYGVRYALEDGWMTARLPSGRKLWYFNPQPVRKAMPWDDTDIRLAWTYQAQKMGQWKTIDAFGGLLTENVVQALARDLMVAAMFKCEKAGLPIVLTVHDEIVTEPEVVNADEVALQSIMCDAPDWAKAMQIPIATETWCGERYKK